MSTQDIRSWPISQHCHAQSARLGFDPDIPEQMMATRNEDAENLMALITNGQPSAAKGQRRFVATIALGALMIWCPESVQADVEVTPEQSLPFQVSLKIPPISDWLPMEWPIDAIAEPAPESLNLIEPFWANPERSDKEKTNGGRLIAKPDAPNVLRAAPDFFQPTENPHPPLVIHAKPEIAQDVVAVTNQPDPVSWGQYLRFRLLALSPFWAALPRILLACAAWLIWRELRRIVRSVEIASTGTTSTENKSEQDEMEQDISDAQESSQIPWKITVGGASHCGQARTENQDAYSVREIAPGIALATTCDGVGGQPGGRTAARYCSRKLKSRISMAMTAGMSAEDAILDALSACPEQMHEDGIEGLTTALITLIEGDRLTWAGLGDGRICIIHPDGMAQDLMAPHHALNLPSNIITAHVEAGQHFTPRIGSMRVEPGSLIFTMSDGAGDLVDINGLAKRRDALVTSIGKTGPEIFCACLLSHLEGLTDKDTGLPLHSDNLTLTTILVEHAGELA